MAIRAMTFDGDNTLWDFESATRAGPLGQSITLVEIRRRSFGVVAGMAGISDNSAAGRLADTYFEAMNAAKRLYPDVLPTLEAMTAGYCLGVITNGNTRPEQLGIDSLFSFVLIAEDEGTQKPDPTIFQIAAERAGCDTAEIMHIGDNLLTDVAGANRAGAISVWLNRAGVPPCAF